MIAALARLWQRPRSAWIDVVPAVAYVAVLFWFGLTPLDRLPGPEFTLKDKLWHLLAFGGVSGLSARVLGHWGRAARPAARDAALLGAGLGGLLELLQGLTAYRSPDWADFLADSIGAGLAYLLLRLLARAAAPEAAGT
jgi:VanZ family protein